MYIQRLLIAKAKPYMQNLISIGTRMFVELSVDHAKKSTVIGTWDGTSSVKNVTFESIFC